VTISGVFPPHPVRSLFLSLPFIVLLTESCVYFHRVTLPSTFHSFPLQGEYQDSPPAFSLTSFYFLVYVAVRFLVCASHVLALFTFFKTTFQFPFLICLSCPPLRFSLRFFPSRDRIPFFLRISPPATMTPMTPPPGPISLVSPFNLWRRLGFFLIAVFFCLTPALPTRPPVIFVSFADSDGDAF